MAAFQGDVKKEVMMMADKLDKIEKALHIKPATIPTGIFFKVSVKFNNLRCYIFKIFVRRRRFNKADEAPHSKADGRRRKRGKESD